MTAVSTASSHGDRLWGHMRLCVCGHRTLMGLTRDLNSGPEVDLSSGGVHYGASGDAGEGMLYNWCEKPRSELYE